MTSTASVRRSRERRRLGRMLLKLEIDGDVRDNLVEAGLLQEWDSENPAAVAEAVVQLLKMLPR